MKSTVFSFLGQMEFQPEEKTPYCIALECDCGHLNHLLSITSITEKEKHASGRGTIQGLSDKGAVWQMNSQRH